MRIVFMGTPEFAASILGAVLKSKHAVVGVVTRPDAVRSRGKKLVASPVKAVATAAGVSVLEASSFKDDAVFEALCAFKPDVICVAAFGALLPQRVLDLPRFGCINVHASLLPAWRGAAPIERAILAGDKQAGISIMRMEAGLDTGPVACMRACEIGTKCAEELTAELAMLGASALVEVLDALEVSGELSVGVPLVEARATDAHGLVGGNSQGVFSWHIQPQEQEGLGGVTYARKLEKGELDLAASMDGAQLARCVQASSVNHPARCVVAGKTLSVKAAQVADSNLCDGLAAGQVRFAAKRLVLGCTDGGLELLVVQPSGKKPMEAKAFAAGVQGIKQGGVTWQALYE